MNTSILNPGKITVRDSYGNNIEITLPETPEPLQIVEFEKDKFHWRKILTIALDSIIIGFSIFGVFCFVWFL